MKRRITHRLLWILGGVIVIVLCGITPLRPSQRSIKTQAALKDLVLSINNYRVEYDRFPLIENQSAKVDQRIESNGKFLRVLLGKNEDGLNPRQLAYIEPPMAKEGRGGLIEETAAGPTKFTDSWGHPYVVLMDGNYDNKLDNPDRKNSSSAISKDAPANIIAGAIAFSVGPDGVQGTVDDIVSWRPPPASPSPDDMRRDLFAWIVAVAIIVSFLVIVGQGFLLLLDLIDLLRGRRNLREHGSSEPL